MPGKRKKVEKIREILQLSLELKFSIRHIVEATQFSKTSIEEYLTEYKRSDIFYQKVLDINDN